MAIISNLEALYINAESRGGDDDYANSHLRVGLFERASKIIALLKAAEEAISPCEHERGFCIAHGTVRLPCPIGDLADALTNLKAG